MTQPPSQGRGESWWRRLFVPNPLRFCLIYFALGIIWILVSDIVVMFVFHESGLYAFGQSIKGVGFITVTTILLYLLLRYYHREIHFRENRLKGAMEIGNLAWWEMDLPDGAVRFDDRKATMLGHRPEEFHHYTDFTSLLHPEDYLTAMNAMRDHLEGRKARYVCEYRIRTAGGGYKWFRDIGGVTLRYSDGSPRTVTGIVIDVSAEKESGIRMQEILAKMERFEEALDRVPSYIYMKDLDSRYLYANKHTLDLFRVTETELTGSPDSRFFPPETVRKLREIDLRVFLGEQTAEEVTIDFPGNQKRVYWEVKTPLYSDKKKITITGLLGISTDITDRKEAEQALKKNETRFRVLVQNSSDFIQILDRRGKLVYEYSSTERVLGYPLGGLVGKDPLELIHPEDLERVRNALAKVFEGTNPRIPIEFRIRGADGTWHWLESVGTNLFGVPGVDGVVLTSRSIEDRKRMEQALKSSETRFRHISGLITDFAYSCRQTPGNPFVIDWTTGAFEKITGYPEEEIREMACWRALVIPEDLPLFDRNIGGLLPGQSAHTELRISRKDNRIVWISSFAECVEAPDEPGTHILYGGCRDITEEKEAEKQIREFTENLEQKIQERTQELSRSLAERELLLREIHHRVKNNLQIMVSLIRLQKNRIPDEITRDALNDSESRIRSMSLIHEKLYRSKDFASINMAEYVRNLATSIAMIYSVNPTQVALKVDMPDLSLGIDSAVPVGLLLNELITNCFKHAFPGGRKGTIEITGKREGPDITMQFRDNGVGLPEGLNWKESPSLGLHLISTLAEQLHGMLEVESSSAGTGFTLHFRELSPADRQT